MAKDIPNKYASKWLLICFLVAVSLFFLDGLYYRLRGYIHYELSRGYSINHYYGLALHHLETAIGYLPYNREFFKEAGRLYLEMANLSSPAEKKYGWTRKAKKQYLQALSLNQSDASAAFGAAFCETQLESIFATMHPLKTNPHDAKSLLSASLSLRPNCFYYHYYTTKYAEQHKYHDLLINSSKKLAYLSPDAYSKLIQENIWSDIIQKSYMEGLWKAIDDSLHPQKAYAALSGIYENNNDWSEAIQYYRKSIQTKEMNQNELFHLGSLYLHAGDDVSAQDAFFAFYRQSVSKNALNDITSLYITSQNYNGLISLYDKIVSLPKGPNDIRNEVEKLIKSKQIEIAEKILKNILMDSPQADDYVFLALISKSRREWLEMAHHIDRAIELDPSNASYRHLKSQAFLRLGQPQKALAEANHAIELQSVADPRLFDFRAKLLFRHHRFNEALTDWKRAIKLDPDNANYYVRAGNASIKAGDIAMGIQYYKIALELKPKDKKILERYRKLLLLE